MAVAYEGRSFFHNIKLSPDAEPPEIGSQLATSVVDIGPYTPSNSALSVGGCIKQLAWDPSGNRIAVSFQSTQGGEGHKLVALFSSKIEPLQFMHLYVTGERAPECACLCGTSASAYSFGALRFCSGFVRGEEEFGVPCHISFKPHYDEGALLTIVRATVAPAMHATRH